VSVPALFSPDLAFHADRVTRNQSANPGYWQLVAPTIRSLLAIAVLSVRTPARSS